jgi:N-acetylmuramic acid 6-phosphate (MurNAc-6-P) etherase
MEMTNLSRPGARRLLARAQGKVKAAIVMHFRKTNLAGALKILNECEQFLRTAIEEEA